LLTSEDAARATVLEPAAPMPALKGTLTYTRYYIDGALPEPSPDKLLKAIRLRVMKPLEPDDEAVERAGWCRVGSPTDLELGSEDVLYNEFVNLGFRFDRWVIPGPMLRAKLRDAEKAYLQKKGRDRLSRREKTELKALVSKKLRRQVEPRMRFVDVSWSLNEGLVRFFSSSSKLGAFMEDLFTKTFAVKLVAEAPYTLAARLGLSAAREKAWIDLEPTSFVDETIDEGV
jgi:recombination associated protein RdgC